MNKLTVIAALGIAMVALAAPVMAADEGAGGQGWTPPVWPFGGAFSAALIILGAGYGIGKIGSCALESMARQPEVAGNVQTAMIIAAALIEGVTFFGLIVCLLAVYASG